MKNKSFHLWLAILCLLLSLFGLVSCGGDEESADATEDAVTAQNTITSVVLERGEITIKASLSQEFLSKFSDGTIYLLELPSHLDPVGELSDARTVAEGSPVAAVMFTVSEFDNGRSRRYSSFVLAAKDKKGAYTAISSTASLENPESTAPVANTQDPVSDTIKGLSSADAAEVIRLGAAHTVVDVYIHELLLNEWAPSAISFIAGGTTAYLDGEALASLDATVRRYTDAGVQVYLRFLLDARHRTEACENADLYFPGTEDTTAAYLAIHVGSSRAASTMEGFFEVMADRYASPDGDTLPVTAFLIGRRVNDPARYAADGQAPNSERTFGDTYIANYEKLLHIAHISIKSHNRNGRVYISLDDRRAVGTEESGWDAQGFLSALRNEANLRGNYDWHVACELYSSASAIWVEHADESGHLTIRNISQIGDLLDSNPYLTPSGDIRRLMISGMSIPAVPKGEEASDARATEQAASYAYAYMSALQYGRIEALIYDCPVDRYAHAEEGALSGLWTAKGSYGILIPDKQRPIYTVFKKIDTSEASDLTAQLTAVIGSPYAKLVAAHAGNTVPVTILSGSAALSESLSPLAEGLLLFEDGTLGGMTNAGHATYLELRHPNADSEDVALHARFDRTHTASTMALTTKIKGSALFGATELSLSLSLLPIDPTKTTPCAVTLCLTVPAKEDAPALAYESGRVELQGDQSVVSFGLENISSRLTEGDEVTLTLLIDGGDDLSYDLDLSGVYVIGATDAPSGSVKPVLVILAIVVPVVAIVAVAFILIRKRKWDY